MRNWGRGLAIVCGVLLLAAAPLLADDGTAAAKEHFNKGTLAYDLGHYAEAAVEYEAAYKAKNDPALLFNLGQAYRAAGDYDNAIRVYRSFLRRVPVSPDRANVEARISELQEKINAEQSAKSQTSLPAAGAPSSSPAEPTPAAHTSSPASIVVAADVTARPTARANKPLYKRWWLWTVVGVVAVGGAVAAVLVTTIPKNAAAPAGSPIITF